MKKIKLFFVVMASLVASALNAQNITVKGNVTDASTGEGVPFAAIQVKGTSTGSATDVNGAYSFSVPSNATLVFSSVGYIEKEVAVNGKTTINVVLEPDSEALEGTVIVGYGSAKKVGSVVGSVTTVKSDIVKNAPSSSALDQLQGQVAGLSVLTTGGVAGENNVSMTLHGVGSLGASSSPLYIIDGVPSSSSAIQMMNPNDILTVSVLKDASATSIYGSRAANGVIYVTTKSGEYETKARVTVRSQYGISTLANLAIYDNMMSGDQLKDFWIRTGLHSAEWVDKNYTSKGYNANTKWYKYFQQLNNPQYQNDVTIEGGGSKVAYMISASQFHQRGTSIGNYYDRYTMRSNVQGHPFNWLKIGTNLNLSFDTTQSNGNWGGASGNANYTSGGLSYLKVPLYPAPTEFDKDGIPTDVKYSDGTNNPYLYMQTHPDVYDTYKLLGSAYAEIEPVRNLKFRSQVGTNATLSLNTWSTIPNTPITTTGYKGKSSGVSADITNTNTIEYSFDIHGDHNFSVLAGHEYETYTSESFSATASGQTDERLLRLNDGKSDTRTVSESLNQYKFLSFFGHFEYNYAQKYNLDLTVRNDASSRFGANNRSATFWSAGVLWRAKKENFLKSIRQINDLRVKASYGTQGNASIGNYAHLGAIGTTTKYREENSWVVSSPSNPALTWEKQALLTLGVSGRFFNMVDLEVEYYNRATSNMLMSVPIPYTTGFSSINSNVGTLANSGIDITLGVDILRGSDYYLRFNTTFNYNSMVVKELFQGRPRWEIANTGVAYVVGKPVMFYYPIYAGVDPTDGAPTWYLPGENVDECTMDPERTTKVFNEAALTQNTGHQRYAPINGGFSISGGWKGFSIAADFSYVLNKYLVNNDMYFYANPANFATMNTFAAVSDYWTPAHTNAAWPDWSKGYAMQFDTHLLENASFLRLKNLQVGYTLPKKWLQGQNVISGLKITLTGRNLLTATNYTGVDPEVNSNLTYGKVGNSKQFLGGIEISF